MGCLGWAYLYLMFIFFYLIMCVDMYFDFGAKWNSPLSFYSDFIYFNFKF